MRKTLGIIIVLIGVTLVAFSLIIKCYIFGFSNIDGSKHITIYAYTLNEEKTKEKVNDYFSDVFAIAASEAEDLKARDISAVHAKVYVSGPDYVENANRSFLDRYYSLFLASIGAIIVILGINLLSEKVMKIKKAGVNPAL